MMAIAAPAETNEPARAKELDRPTLERCRLQDRAAFRAFVVHYQRLVWACLSRISGRGPHVEDLAQEVFLKAFRAMPSFVIDGPAKPSTWLLTIATHAALDARKRRVIPLFPLDDEARAITDGTTPETHRARTELGRAIDRAAEKLPDDQRAALVLVEHHGLSLAEVAQILGVPEATVKTRLFRAREKMRAALGADWKES